MLNELKNEINRMARTENGAVTLYSTGSSCSGSYALNVPINAAM